MKKNKIVIITLIIGILFLTSYLYNTYATSTGISLGNDENTYDILLSDSTDTVSVPAKSSKTVYYQFSNTNKGTIKYHIGYISNNVIAKVWWDTEDPISDTIEQGEYKFIKLKLINDTTSDDTITIKPVLGYVNGGDLIPDSNTTLVTGTINETNTMSVTPTNALNTLGIAKTAVEEISFVKDNIVPNNALGSTNMNNDGSVKLWYTASDTEGMYKVYVGSNNGIVSFPSNSRYLFGGYSNLISLKLTNIDTSNVENMGDSQYYGMFYGCSSLVELDLSNFNLSNVRYIIGLFNECKSLKKIVFCNSNVSHINNISYMFYNCTSLTEVDLSALDTSNVTNMSYMFYRSKVGKVILDTSGCIDMSYMFMQLKATSLDLSTFDTSKVKNMSNMFNGSSNLKQLNLSNFYTPKVTNTSRMFYNVPLRQINVSNFILGVTNVSEMFGSNNYLQLLDMRNADFSNTTSNTYVFPQGGISKTATIYLKDTQGNRDLISNNYSTWTNVQYIPSS